MYQAFVITGIIGSIICAIGDFFLYRCQGTDSVRIGEAKKIESNWEKAPASDFIISGALASISIPLYYLGFVAFAHQIALQNKALGIAYFIVMSIGAMGGVGFHLNACFMPLIYKSIIKNNGSLKMVEDVYSIMSKATGVSAFLTYLILIFVNSIWVWIVIFSGIVAVPKVMCLLTPLMFLVTGILLSKCSKLFHIFPLALTNTLGLGGIAVIALISMM
ncbi:MAG: hypothetical protein K5751_01580 [Treponemataceae bacterium]|nr:hypothetical protein [Treponemataceae bacterium]